MQKKKTHAFDFPSNPGTALGRCVSSNSPPGFEVSDQFSARTVMTKRKLVFLACLALVLLFAFVFFPNQTQSLSLLLLAVPFFCVVLLRGSALWFLFTSRNTLLEGDPLIGDSDLPRYSILVPLYDEVDILDDLLAALAAISYPTDKLDIQWIVEACDHATHNAVRALELPAHMRITVVPDTVPRTKPKAVNYALENADGDIVVIFDAEDVPEPDQLRRAASALAADPSLGCVQARLNVYNRNQNFLTRQFTIEYTALFDCILPTLSRLGFPVPLGGTSNHFPSEVLRGLGGWDSYNVTEDADLGICLARAGYRVAVLRATTWEEAPSEFSVWMRQRTRWLKGWLQTYLVHMRDPAVCRRQLGTRAFLGMQVFMAGVLLSVLVHPWVYIFAGTQLFTGSGSAVSQDGGAGLFWWVAIFNLVAGYFAGIVLGGAAVLARGWRTLSVWSLAMPIYWIMISCAAYRAVWQVITRPHFWEKTKHRPRRTDEIRQLNQVG